MSHLKFHIYVYNSNQACVNENDINFACNLKLSLSSLIPMYKVSQKSLQPFLKFYLIDILKRNHGDVHR